MSDAKPVLINSVSGLRGIVGTSLTVEKAMQFACATGRLLSDLSTVALAGRSLTMLCLLD